ncbi:hypothetical protein M2407_005193 [Serratia sp. BIGb0234]|uniref:DUF4255 domain-containing protein n=1 Tax=Serratia sp. BIGb0234 TaxID=2940614 RepID=UPI00216A843D|nr:DUF4255 domain-containing protein [Serratia sp. BIGb0234]MCS4320819.1 hypothetical protein [Serratia sp. BIGb0234]
MSANNRMFEELSDIAKLNERIRTHVKQHITDIELRFDEPDPEHPPTSPTLHLFMYLIHEDLSIRHSTQRNYNPASGSFAAESAYVRCLYLVTYWDGLTSCSSDAPGAQTNSPTVLRLTDMLKALLCMRNHHDFKDYMVRVIEPEALNSLGNFWQALGNKPRAIINFAVTLPVNIQHPGEKEVTAPAVQSIENQLVQFSGDGLAALEAYLFDELRQRLGKQANLALKKVVIDIRQSATLGKGEESTEQVTVAVVGVTFSETKNAIEDCVDGWRSKKFPLNGKVYQVMQVTHSLLAPGTK